MVTSHAPKVMVDLRTLLVDKDMEDMVFSDAEYEVHKDNKNPLDLENKLNDDIL